MWGRERVPLTTASMSMFNLQKPVAKKKREGLSLPGVSLCRQLSFLRIPREKERKKQNKNKKERLKKQVMSTPARRRLMRDFKRLQNDPPSGISGAPCDNNIMLWNAVIFGPDDTPWEGGTFRLVGRHKGNILSFSLFIAPYRNSSLEKNTQTNPPKSPSHQRCFIPMSMRTDRFVLIFYKINGALFTTSLQS